MIELSQSILLATFDHLQSFSSAAHCRRRWQDVFGLGASRAESSELRRQWQARDFSQLPAIEVVAGDALGTANAAYAAGTNRIYLRAAFVARSAPHTVVRALIEEIGHFVDARVNRKDTPGDEGESFANAVLGIVVRPGEARRIATEDDRSVIDLFGQSLEVERSDAMVLEVTTTTDERDGSVAIGSGLSLRDAMIIANNNQATDIVIRLAGGLTYPLRASGFQEDDGLKGDLDVKARTGTLVIEASGSSKAILDASDLALGDRVIDVLSGGNLGLSNIVITGGNTARDGGGIRVGSNGVLFAVESEVRNNISIQYGSGIYSEGTVHLDRVNVSNNLLGSGIFNKGKLLLLNSTISENEKEGIHNGESAMIINSTISANREEGLYNGLSSSAGLINTTVSGNGDTGISSSNSSLTITNCTITNNVADRPGGAAGIESRGGSTSLRNTIVAGNRNLEKDGYLDLSGRFFGNNNNLIGSMLGASGSIGTGSDRVNVDPALTPLQNNGGLVLTHALIAGSAAINAGNNARVILDDEDLDQDGNTTEPIPFDARGAGFARIVGKTVDIGAVEARGLGLPSLSIESATTMEGDVGQQAAIVTLRLNVASDDPVSVDFKTKDGSATAEADYLASSGTIQFGVGETSKDITIPILGDGLREPDENLLIQLSNPLNAILFNSSATLTIADNEPSISLQPVQSSVLEGDSGSTNFLFSVTLSKASFLPVTVNYATADDIAKAGVDYTLTSGTLTFAPGEVSRTIAVPILADEVFEGTLPAGRAESFLLNLSFPSANASIANGTARGLIVDDEPTIAVEGRKIVEGNSGSKTMLFPVTLSRASNSAVGVNYTTANGTAVAGKDYGFTSGSLTFAPGEVNKMIAVPILGDQNFEENFDGSREEQFQLVLSEATANAAIAIAQENGIIIDTDLPLTSLVSVALSTDRWSASTSSSPAVSGDGRYVAFVSDHENLVLDDTNRVADIFLRDRLMGETKRVSVTSDGTQATHSRLPVLAYSSAPAISADGRWITFVSNADNLVPGDNNGVEDIFVHDRQTGQTTRVSVGTGGFQANGASTSPSISGDGRFIAFASEASNLADRGSSINKSVLVHDRITGQTTQINRTPNGTASDSLNFTAATAINATGRYVVYVSQAVDLVTGDTNNKKDVFVYDREEAVTTRVSIATGGGQANGDSDSPSISGDGRYVVFRSDATTLVGGINGGIFLHDRQTRQTTNVVVGVGGEQGNGPSRAPRISQDGRYVVYESMANNLVANDNNSSTDVFRYDIQTGQTQRISVSAAGVQSNDDSGAPAVSGDGRYVAFQSDATNLVLSDSQDNTDIFIHDTLAIVESPPLVSLSLNPAEVWEDGSNDLVFTFSREGSLIKPLRVNVEITGTASGTSDYAQTGALGLNNGRGTVLFAANAATATLRINPTPDTTMEPDESVSVSLLSGPAYAVDTLEAVTGMLKDDDLPVISLTASPQSVPEDGETKLTFTFSRTGILTGELSVGYTLGGTALNTSDYTGISGADVKRVITFAAGSATATLLVDPSADTGQEGNETVSLTLASGTGYKVGTTKAVVGTIINDDFVGTSAKNTIQGSIYSDYIDGGAGADVLTGAAGADRFHFRFGQSTHSAPDRIADFLIGSDRITLIASDGSVLPAPSAVTRAANNATATTTLQLCRDVFTDANGAMTGKQALGAGEAAIVVATNSNIAGTYILCNDADARLTISDVLINIKGYSGALPDLGGVAPSLLFA